MSDQRPRSRVNIRPGVTVLSVLRHLNYQPWFALAEFVDNSVQSYLVNRERLVAAVGDSYKLAVEITQDEGRLTIRDNAAGIALADFPRAFRAAEVPPDRTLLSEFGIGMKAAACWFSPVWQVRTSALGEPVERTIRFEIEHIVREAVEELEVVEVATKSEYHFTEVVLDGLHRPLQSRTIAKIKEHLSDIYRQFFRSGELELSFNGEPLSYKEPKILVAPYYKDVPPAEPRKWNKEIDLDFGLGLRVTGFAAIRDPAKTSGAGFALFRRRRLIQGSGDQGYRPERLFGKPNDFRYQRIFGELHLEGFKVSHTKDGVVWEEYEDEFLDLLEEQLKDPAMPLLQQAREHRARRSPRDVREVGQGAVDGTAEALERELPSALQGERIKPPTEQLESRLPPAADTSTREIAFDRDGQTWKLKVELVYDPAVGDWFSFSDSGTAGRPPDAARRLCVRVSMMHPFMEQFCHTDRDQIEALLRVATAIAVAEVVAREGGVRQAGTIRREVNRLLREALCKR